MRGLTLLSAAAVATLMTGVSFGADLMMAPPAPAAAMTSDWTGGYIGVAGSWSQVQPSGDQSVDLNVVVGANLQTGMFLVGLEGHAGVDYDYTIASTQGTAGIAARAGFVVGDAALLYGALGYDWYSGSGNTYYTASIGAEFMVSDSMSLDLRYTHGMGANNANTTDAVSAGLNWHM
ncbi:MAG: outer membrane beta-barrel protein [Devosia sp.]